MDEVEETFINDLNSKCNAILVARIVRSDSAELYFYLSKELSVEDASKANPNWIKTAFVFDDSNHHIYQEMLKSNFFTMNNIANMITFPEVLVNFENDNIDKDNELEIKFSFYTASAERPTKMIESMEKIGYRIENKSTRMLFFLKGNSTKAVKSQVWNLSKLYEAYSMLILIAQANNSYI